jgi:hypothetical protein
LEAAPRISSERAKPQLNPVSSALDNTVPWVPVNTVVAEKEILLADARIDLARARPVAAILAGQFAWVLSITSPLAGFVSCKK